MDSIESNIAEYQEGIKGVRARIEWLGEQIATERAKGHAVKELLDRRYLLYTQLAEMQYALGSLQEYQRQMKKK